MKKALSILLALALAAGASACGAKDAANSSSQTPAASAASASESASSETASSGADAQEVPTGPEYTAKMKAMVEGTGEFADNPIVTMETSEGTVKLRLFPEEAPKAVENFVGLIKKGYYDGVTFHRVIQDFMIQGGDPDGTGMGGDSLWGEDFDIEYGFYMWHLRGCLSMANTGVPTSNGSQFYIVQGDNHEAVFSQYQGVFPAEITELFKEYGGRPDLDLLNPEQGRYGYTKFGYVTEGMDVVDKIAALDSGTTDAQGSPEGKTSKPVTITKMTVEEK